MRKPIDNQHPSGSTSAAGRTLAPNARHLTALNNFPCLRIRSLPPSPRANAQRPPTEAALRCNTRSCRFLGSAGTAPNRKSRTRNNRQREALAGFRSPCSHRRTGRRRWASFQRPGAGRPGKSGSIQVASPLSPKFFERSGSAACRKYEDGHCMPTPPQSQPRKDSQHPRQMVFSFASNFEFSTASISTTCP
jgi:hypothetical protein